MTKRSRDEVYADYDAAHDRISDTLNDIVVNPIVADPIVDPTAARDLTINADFIPKNVNELVIAVTTLVRSVSPGDVETVYNGIKGVLKNNVNNTPEDDFLTKSKGKSMSKKTNENKQAIAENVLRSAIRRIIMEDGLAKKLSQQDDLEPDDEFDEPVSGVRSKIAAEPEPEDDLASYARALDDIDPRGLGPDGTQKKWSISGAKQAIDKATRKLGFGTKMSKENPEAFDDMLWDATEDYIKYLESSVGKGDEPDLTPDDINLLRKNPQMVQDLDGFREFLDKYYRRAGYKSDTDYSSND